MRVAEKAPGFAQALEDFLNRQVVAVDKYPMLRDLLWTGRRRRWIAAEEAFRLYEHDRRFVEPQRLNPDERALLRRLAVRFGSFVRKA